MLEKTNAGSWYEATATRTPIYPKLVGARIADVTVIGAGYTGLSTALHLAQLGYDVCIVEQKTVGWGASGRNGGQICTGQRQDMFELEKILPYDEAKKLWFLAEEAKSLVRSLIKKHNIPCDLKQGQITVASKTSHYRYLCNYVDHLRSRYSYKEMAVFDKKQVEDYVATTLYHGGLVDYGAGHLHPLNFSLGLAELATTAGANIFQNSSVTKIDRKDSGYIVQTESGSLKTDCVVIACNGYLEKLEPRLSNSIMPINNFILATEPLGKEKANSLIRDNLAVTDTKFVVNYFRLSSDYRLLFGGGETYSTRFPKDIGAFVRPYMLRVFPELETTKIHYSWGGKLAITRNRLPVFGRLDDNIYYALGYSGQGVALATLSGKILAEAISKTVSDFDIFCQLPRKPFPGGSSLRWPILALAMTYYSIRDRL